MRDVDCGEKRIAQLKKIAYTIRRELIKLSARKAIHIGGCLSAADILTVLWQEVLSYDFQNPKWEGRDRFFLSKGHCQAAVAFNLAQRGAFSAEEVLREYGTDHCRFSMAPCRHTNPFYESSATGSLGQGLPLGAGVATALLRKGNGRSKVFVLVGDGELQEGSNWEAAMYASQRKLSNLVCVVDNNQLQFDGKTDEIISVEDINRRFSSFGWDVRDVDGHDVGALLSAFAAVKEAERPVVINARTVKGKGVSYMEGNYVWHAGKIREGELGETLRLLQEAYPEESHV